MAALWIAIENSAGSQQPVGNVHLLLLSHQINEINKYHHGRVPSELMCSAMPEKKEQDSIRSSCLIKLKFSGMSAVASFL